MKKHELKLISVLLDMAADEFGNHGCNDFDLTEDTDLTPEQVYEVNRDFHERNGDLDEIGEDELTAPTLLGDWCVMRHLADLAREEADGIAPAPPTDAQRVISGQAQRINALLERIRVLDRALSARNEALAACEKAVEALRRIG